MTKNSKLNFARVVLIGLPNLVFGQRQKVEETVRIIKHRQQYPNYMLVSAHRGYWAEYPENTTGAYQAAIDIGADIVEMDIRLTRDSYMVVFHDACLDRMTTGYGRLREEDLAYVNSLYLKTHEGKRTSYKVLRLSEALDFIKDKAVFSLDIIETGDLFKSTMVAALKLLKSKGMLYQAVIKGKLTLFELQSVITKAGVTLDDFIYTPIAFRTTPNLEQYLNDFVNTGKIYAIELVYKQTSDPILQYVSLLKEHNIWLGTFSFWPECGDGVVAEKVPLTDTDAIVRDYVFRDKDPNNFLDDGRGTWDWLFPLGANYVVTDRSEILIDYLIVLGKRIK